MVFDRFCRYGGECVGCRDCIHEEPAICPECCQEVEDEDALDHGMCVDCQNEVMKKLADLLSKTFTANELALLDDRLEGVYLTEFIKEHVTQDQPKEVKKAS